MTERFDGQKNGPAPSFFWHSNLSVLFVVRSWQRWGTLHDSMAALIFPAISVRVVAATSARIGSVAEFASA
jgi:hypothetical protein